MKCDAKNRRKAETKETLEWLCHPAMGLASLARGWDCLEVSYIEEQDAFHIKAEDRRWGYYEWNELLRLKGLDIREAALKLVRRLLNFDPRKEEDWAGEDDLERE